MPQPPTRPERDLRWVGVAWGVAALLMALRIPHLTGPLDDPHSWRQCDTVYYTLDFARRGLDLLHPAVCWLGAHRTLVLEFPLPEAIAALLYRAFGPDVLWDRLVTLAFFALGTVALHRVARRLAGVRAAWFATLAWLAFPLGQFYSRAPVVDVAAVALGLVLLDLAWLAFARRSVALALAAAATGSLAAMIKAPALVPLAGPLLLVWLAAPPGPRLRLGALAFAPLVVAFALWRRHVDAVNAATPDWSFLPGWYREVNPLWWYFGSWDQRLEPSAWWRLARRLLREATTLPGALLAVLALALPERGGSPSPRAFAFAWLLGAFAYLAAFFSLNLIHSYYQVPFLPPLALLVGLGADALAVRLPGRAGPVVAAAAFAVFLAAAVVAPARLGYYRVDELRERAGDAIEARVPPGELVVAADHNSGWSDPRLLQRADRDGFPVAVADLDRVRLARLEALGARWVAVVTSPAHPEIAPPEFLAAWRVAEVALAGRAGALGTLHLYSLGADSAAIAMGAR